ncbi:MAG: GGDEF domain-containing protein [Lachnospiraceae bacterium]|nr:GGDEF domain-containing protein [Lachnospiraceae bacterium]
MYNIESMDEKVKSFCSAEVIFNLYRLVDPYTYEVFDYAGGKKELLKERKPCYEFWNKTVPCENCVSRRSCDENKQFVKVEQLKDEALLIVSVPVMLENKVLSLELIKNVTESMVVVSEYHKDNVQITEFIKEFNDFAVKDSFTGLYNKSYIRNELDAFINFHRNTHYFLIGVCIDVDNFKKVNDEHGHNVGDIVLQHISAVIKGTVNRHNGWAGRLGGDEFVMFFENKTAEEVEQVCKKMSNKIEKFTYKAHEDTFNVTISFGIEQLQDDDDWRQFLDRIDRSMYAKKRMH